MGLVPNSTSIIKSTSHSSGNASKFIRNTSGNLHTTDTNSTRGASQLHHEHKLNKMNNAQISTFEHDIWYNTYRYLTYGPLPNNWRYPPYRQGDSLGIAI